MDAPDPYRPPRADVNAPPGAEASTVGPLYSVNQITGATILGSPMAGAVLLGSNFRALGKPRARTAALVWGAVATAVLVGLGALLPERMPSSFLPIIFTLGLRTVAQQLQGAVLAAHAKAAGPRQSNWRVAGIALACFAALGVVATAIVVAYARIHPTPGEFNLME
jgi:hypothetical protein